MRRFLSLSLVVLLAISMLVGLVSIAQAYGSAKAISAVPEVVETAATPSQQPTPTQPESSAPPYVPELAGQVDQVLTPQQFQQAQFDAEKEMEEQNRLAFQIMQNHDRMINGFRRQVSPQPAYQSKEPAAAPRAAHPMVNPASLQKDFRLAQESAPLPKPAAYSITVETLHRNDNFGTGSIFLINNQGGTEANVVIDFYWPNDTLQSTDGGFNIAAGGSRVYDLLSSPTGYHFVGKAVIYSDQPLTAQITSPDYGMIGGRLFQADGVTPLTNGSTDIFIDRGNNWFEGKGGYGVLSDGRFYIGGLPDNVYVLRAMVGYPYAQQFYSNKQSANDADSITISSGSDFSTADFTMHPGGRIEGTVYAADGITPLPNINVDLEQGWYGTCTDASGHFTMDNVPYGDQYIRAGGDWNWCENKYSIYVREYYQEKIRLSEATALSISAGSDLKTGINFTLTTGGTVRGRVNSAATGLPLANVHVAASIYTNNDEWYWGNFTTGASGVYTITGLPAGDYRVRIDDMWGIPDGYAREFYPNTPNYDLAQPIAVPAGGTISNIDFALEPGGIIRGRVVDQDTGLPLPNINVNADPGLGWGISACTNSNGEYELRALPYAGYRLQGGNDWSWCGTTFSPYIREYFSDALRYDQATVLQVNSTTPILNNTDFGLLKGGMITGKVTAQQGGQPLANVHVAASIYTNNDEWYWSNMWTDATGVYTVTGLPEGNYRVRVDDGNGIPAGYAQQYYDHTVDWSAAKSLHIAGTLKLTGIDFALEPGGVIRGRVVDQVTGLPVARMTVNSGRINQPGGVGTCTDDQGYYELRGLPYGDYEVSSGGYNYCLGQPGVYVKEIYLEKIYYWNRTPVAVNSATPVTGINFTLEHGGFISGKVTDGDLGNAQVGNLRVGAQVPDPQCNGCTWWVGDTNTDSQGNYLIGPLPAGVYKVYACADCTGQLLVSEYYNNVYFVNDAQEVNVTIGNTTSGINMVLGKGVWITGKVTVPNGYSPADIQVDTWLFDHNYGASRRTDASGNYTIPVPPIYDSMWGIAVRPWGTDLELEWAHRVWLNQGTKFDFNLGPGGKVEGCVTDGGIPLTSGNVNVEGSWMNNGTNIGADGCYSITNLPPGDYRVRADNWPNYSATYYGGPNWEYATPVRLSVGEMETGKNIEMHKMGRITGLVRDFTTHKPTEGVQVVAMSDKGYYQGWSQVDGTYSIDLPVGSYKIFYMQDSWVDYFGTFYPYSQTYEGGTSVSVPAYNPDGAAIVNIDFHKKAKVTGTITDSASGKPLGGIFVKVNTRGQSGGYEPAWSSSQCTDETGSYALEAFWPGQTYRITVAGTCGSPEYGKVTRELAVAEGGAYVENFQLVAGVTPQVPFTIKSNDTDYLPENIFDDQNVPLLFEPLVKLDDQGNWTSNLLVQVPTVENGGVQVVNSQMIVTYQLKPGLLWSDGVALTSADIQYAFERLNTPTMWWNNSGTHVSLIERVETPNALTAVAYYHKDQITANYIDAILYPIPKHILQGQFPFMWGRFYLANPVGNGPYIVEEFLSDSYVILHANPNYVLRSLGLPKIERIRQINSGNAFGMIASGQAQVSVALDDGNLIPSGATSFLNVKSSTNSSTEFIYLNNEKPAFQDVSVRKAFMMALNRARLADYGKTGMPSFIPAANLFPPGSPMYSSGFTQYSFDLAQAGNLLSAAGWLDHNGNGTRDKGGVEMVFTFAYPAGNDRRMRLASTFQEDLGKIGVRLNLVQVGDFNTMIDNGTHGIYDMFICMWGLDPFDPDAYNLFYSINIPKAYNSYELQNYTRWQNATNDALLELIHGQLSFSALKSAYATWNQNFTDQVPSLPTIHGLRYDLALPTLVNFKPGAKIPATWNVAEWYLPPNPYDLGVRMTLAPESPALQPGAIIIYALNVDNAGFFGVTHATLLDTLPGNVTYKGATPAPTTITGNKLYWNLGDIPAGQALPVIKVSVEIPLTAVHGDKITNLVQVYSDQIDTRPENNATEYQLEVREDIDLWLEKHGIGQPAVGEKFTYYIEYGNLGGAPAASVVITDVLPAQVSLISAVPTPVVNGSLLTWNLGELKGDQWGGQIVVTAEIDNKGQVVNIARVQPATGEMNLANNQDNHVEDVNSILAPVILRPTAGTTDGTLTVKGLAPSNSTVTIYDINPVIPVLLASGTATASGTFEIPLSLAEGSYVLAAKANKVSLDSEYSNTASIQVDHDLPLDPDLVNIMIDGVDFSAGVVRGGAVYAVASPGGDRCSPSLRHPAERATRSQREWVIQLQRLAGQPA